MSNDLVLKLNLYPGTEIIESALNTTDRNRDVIDVVPESMTETDWDNLVDKILQAEKILSL